MIDIQPQILYSVTCALVIVCCFYGAGQLSEDLTPPVIMHGTKVKIPRRSVLLMGAAADDSHSCSSSPSSFIRHVRCPSSPASV